MPAENLNFSFEVSLYGTLVPYNEVLSKARARVFYKGLNRNGTYITDEFAELMINSLAYVPVKGIYDLMDEDYTDHGYARDLGRIYGIVPENPNVTWEAHTDEDGVERTYLCVDVLLYTALYKEANEILGKSLSMEVYPPSIDGEWEVREGKKCFVFKKGCFLGLQVLGDDVEPCFEGAAFFSLYSSLKELVQKIESYSLEPMNKGGEKTMSVINFKLSDREKFDAIWALLNTNYGEETNWEVRYSLLDIYDSYAIAYDYEEGKYMRVYYSKDDASNSLTLGEMSQCFIVDVTEDEQKALTAIQAVNGGSYEKLDVNFVKSEELENQKVAYEAKISEFEQKSEEDAQTIATLITERDNAQEEKNALELANNSLKEENEALSEYKANSEKEKKEEVLSKYALRLNSEVIDGYTENINNYSVVDLEKELAYALVQNDPAIFSNEPAPQLVPQETQLTGIEGILSKYTK